MEKGKDQKLDGLNLEQRHGKERVRVGRVWRTKQGPHFMVEWNVSISLLSDCLNAYVIGDNSDIVATDTMKNTVYVKAKECSEPLSAEDFAILLAKHFTSFYKQVNVAIVTIVEKPWERINIDGQPHEHGLLMCQMSHNGEKSMFQVNCDTSVFKIQAPARLEAISLMPTHEEAWFGYGFKLGSERHTTEAVVKKSGVLQLTSGIEALSVLKTTKSGFEGFIRDRYTALPDTRERIVATEVTATWRYSYESVFSVPQNPLFFTEKYLEVRKALLDTFFGPPNEGVYSPSVQSTLFLMAKAVLNRFHDISSVKLKMPNLHFLPVNISSKDNVIVQFNDDVYLPTDEPHGSIEASLSRSWSKM